VEDIDSRVDFVVGNSNKLQKLGLEGKTQLSPPLSSYCQNLEIFNLKM
jgi:hypothetical protein